MRRTGSVVAEGEPLRIAAGPAVYEISYDLRQPAAPTLAETVAVAQPFLSRRTSRNERSETSFARLASTPAQGTTTVVSPPPAAVDPRPALVVERAVAEGVLQRREQRVVLGRRCQVFRSQSSVAASTISAPLPGTYTDTCISADGLLLDEWQVMDGRPVRQRVATAVRTDGITPLAPVSAEPTLNAEQGGGSVLEVDAASRPVGRFYEVDEPPAGFTRRGRYSVIPPQAGLTDATQRRKAVASTADVYERGTDVLVVDRGGTLDLARAFQPRPEGRPVDIGPLFPEAELLLSWSGPEVRWADDDGKFVRVYGTVPVDELLAVARSLRAVDDGTGLVFLGR